MYVVKYNTYICIFVYKNLIFFPTYVLYVQVHMYDNVHVLANIYEYRAHKRT